MTVGRWNALAWVPIGMTIAAVAFGAGVTWGETRCMPAIDVLRAEVKALRAELDAHQSIPLHPGAASSDVVRQLEYRLQRLENERRNH